MKKPLFSAAFSFPREAQRDTLRKFRSGSPPEPFPQYRPPRCHMPDSAYTGNQSGYIMTPSRRGPRPLDASQQQRSRQYRHGKGEREQPCHAVPAHRPFPPSLIPSPMVPEMQKDQREKGDAGERMHTAHTCHTSWLCVSPATCSLTPVASTAAKSGTNAASVINILRFPLIFFPQSNGATNMRTMDGTG